LTQQFRFDSVRQSAVFTALEEQVITVQNSFDWRNDFRFFGYYYPAKVQELALPT
jgi:hypothetical protein